MLASDPFTIISSALIQTGNSPPVVAYDGTDEWIACFNAYELWLPYCIEARDWNFQTAIISLVRTGNATYPRFTDRFAMPPNCIHMQTVWRPDLAAQMPVYLGWGMMSGAESIHPPAVEYRIIGGEIETSAPAGLMAKYLAQPSGTDNYTATFTAALIAYVASSAYASLNEDLASAEKTFQVAEGLLQKAASRSDQQENRRVAFRSRMLERRRARYAPWGTVS
jgi:hypothetical protein